MSEEGASEVRERPSRKAVKFEESSTNQTATSEPKESMSTSTTTPDPPKVASFHWTTMEEFKQAQNITTATLLIFFAIGALVLDQTSKTGNRITMPVLTVSNTRQ